MTEEQRYQQKIRIETDRNKCLKGIWDELKSITGLLKVQAGVAPVCDVANEEDLEELKEKLYKARDGIK
jgi:hypothetical protein